MKLGYDPAQWTLPSYYTLSTIARPLPGVLALLVAIVLKLPSLAKALDPAKDSL